MNLTDAQIDRWSRQILLPEVGGRGQERLCAARVEIAGAGPAAALAATLVGRAGAGRGTPADAVLALDVAAGEAAPCAPGGGGAVLIVGRRRGPAIRVATLVGQPCGACLDPALLPAADGPDDDPLAGPAAQALGALAAGEALAALLVRPATGHLLTLDLATGAARRDALVAAGCPACGPAA